MPVNLIDKDICIGCGTCVESCPMDVFRLDTIVPDRQEQAPCRLACPLGVNPREYHNLIKLNLPDEAAKVLQRYHPMPAITGRVCPHPCETECTRNEVEEAININGLEQYLGDHLLDLEPPVVSLPEKAQVAIIGSGPAGLSAAYHLTLSGYKVIVFEKDEKPGGLIRYAVPNFRLPEDVLDKQIEYYKKMGIQFETGVRFGQDITREELEKQGISAFIAATGAAKPFEFTVPGSDAEGVTNAMDFLTGVKTGQIKQVPGSVAVVGGGSVAMDAARSAIRLGAEHVTVVCLECLEPNLKDSMLAEEEEIEAALAEGVKIHPSTGVNSFKITDGRVSGITGVECLSVRDEDGSFNPEYAETPLPQAIKAETVILAIGQTADPELVPDGFAVNQRGLIVADQSTMQVAPGLFAAGDAVSGQSTVVEALAAGKRAALTVDRFLRGQTLPSELVEQPQRAASPPPNIIQQADRINRETLPAEACIGNFQSTVLPLSQYQAWMEAQRCLTCGSRAEIAFVDDCQVCRLCQVYCPTDAIEVTEGVLLGSLHCWDVVTLD